MNLTKPIVVREYDRIYGHDKKEQEREGQKVFISHKDYNDLERFVKEFKSDEGNAIQFLFGMTGKYKYGKDGDFDEIDSFFSICKNYISVKNYVGTIQLPSGLKIDVLPKVIGDESLEFDIDAQKKTRDVFLKMLSSMTDFPFKVFEKADLSLYSMSLFDVFLYIYLLEVGELSRRGIKSQYLTEEDDLKFFRGKLLVREHIKRNVAHKERFYVEYDDYSLNRPENRLIKSALEKLKRLVVHQTNKKLISQLLSHFEHVEISVNYKKDFDKIVLDRTTKSRYENIILWTELILYNFGLNTFTGDRKATSILFKMNDLFEAYIYKEFRKVAGEKGNRDIVKKGGFNKKHLFESEFRDGICQNGKKFRLEPDIMVLESGSCRALLDTKWKVLKWGEANHGVSNADIYQMFAYSQKYDCNDIWLIYPKVPLENWEKSDGDYVKVMYEAELPDEKKVRIRIFFVDLFHIKGSMNSLVEEIISNT